jgi:hypothetical protein
MALLGAGVLACTLVVQVFLVPLPPNTDHFTDSYGLQNTVDKALYKCYHATKMYASLNPEAKDLYEFYWKCLFNYGVVI